jgi:hypothetical protein
VETPSPTNRLRQQTNELSQAFAVGTEATSSTFMTKALELAMICGASPLVLRAETEPRA